MKKYPEPKRFYPKNPHKYIGKTDVIIARSQLETKFMLKFDNDPRIKFWNSEDICVNYYITSQDKDGKWNLIDPKPHRYFVDLWCETINGEKYLIEVKPYSQTHKPRASSKKSDKTILNEALTWAKNDSKWRAARKFCEEKGWNFRIFTERDL